MARSAPVPRVSERPKLPTACLTHLAVCSAKRPGAWGRVRVRVRVRVRGRGRGRGRARTRARARVWSRVRIRARIQVRSHRRGSSADLLDRLEVAQGATAAVAIRQDV